MTLSYTNSVHGGHKKKVSIFNDMFPAHYTHHSRSIKDGFVAFGFLIAPMKHASGAFILEVKKQETQ